MKAIIEITAVTPDEIADKLKEIVPVVKALASVDVDPRLATLEWKDAKVTLKVEA